MPMPDLKKLFDAIVEGDAQAAREITEQALQEQVNPLTLVNDFMAPAMDEVGQRFERCDYFVPELLISARAMKSALELIRPLLVAQGAEPVGRVVIGTVKGDLHDIGKNLVASMLEGGGFEVLDLGVNVDPAKFVDAVQGKKANVVAMSALLTTTMNSMRVTIEALKQAGVRDQVKVLIGGAPITDRFASEIGADGYSENAVEAVALARRVLGIAKAA
jgi:5-methyltetrahydrofolate--homocysteine methyltransferase